MLAVAITRSIPLLRPLAAPDDHVLVEMADALRRSGNHVVRVSGSAIEFAGPGASAGGHAAIVRGGVVTLDPASPERRIRVQLRFGVAGWLWAPLAACLAVALVGDAALRAVIVVGILTMWWSNCDDALAACKEMVSRAARQA